MADLNKIKLKKRRKPSYFYFLLFFIFLGVLVFSLFFSGYLEIKRISISGNSEVSKEEILKIISREIDGKYAGIVEKNNLMLISDFRIKKEIISNFVQVKSVKISKKFPDSIFVESTERIPKIILSSSGENWVIDEDGSAFMKIGNPLDFANEKQLVVLINENAKPIIPNEVNINREYLDYFSNIEKKFEENQIEIEKEIRTPQIISKDLRLRTKAGWTIFLDANISLEKEIEMIKTVLESKIEKDKISNLEYIDLRIENKVYYKLRNSEKFSTENTVSPPTLEEKKEEKKKKKD